MVVSCRAEVYVLPVPGKGRLKRPRVYTSSGIPDIIKEERRMFQVQDVFEESIESDCNFGSREIYFSSSPDLIFVVFVLEMLL